jgi:hypothetical protein
VYKYGSGGTLLQNFVEVKFSENMQSSTPSLTSVTLSSKMGLYKIDMDVDIRFELCRSARVYTSYAHGYSHTVCQSLTTKQRKERRVTGTGVARLPGAQHKRFVCHSSAFSLPAPSHPHVLIYKHTCGYMCTCPYVHLHTCTHHTMDTHINTCICANMHEHISLKKK